MSSKTAHKRFKERFNIVLAVSLMASVVLHVMVFILWPTSKIETYPPSVNESSELVNIVSPPRVSIPDAPSGVSRPALPQVPDIDLSEDITIEPTTFEDNPPPELPPPPSYQNNENRSVFSTRSIIPYLSNRDEVVRALKREYPKHLDAQGIGGTVVVEILINKDGDIIDSKIVDHADHAELDSAALSVVEVFEFTPALNMDKPVDAWIRIPIKFISGNKRPQ